MPEIKDLLSKEAQDVLKRSHRKQMLLDAEAFTKTFVEAEERRQMKIKIALAKMQRAKKQVEADEKEKEKRGK